MNLGRLESRDVLTRVGIITLITLVYIFLFLLLFPSVGDALGSLSIVPIVIAGWLLGMRRGLVYGLILFFINEGLYGFASTTVDTWSAQSIPGLVFALVSSGIVGGLSDLVYKTREQSRQIEQQSQDLMREITQRMKLEVELMDARDQALAASRTKTELLANVSHELRTPLGAILGFAEMFQEGVLGEVTEDQLVGIDQIVDSAHYLTKLVEELLDQVRIESEGINLDIMPFDIRELSQQIEPTMQKLAQAKGLHFHLYVSPDLPNPIRGDQHRLRQIMINLVGNAIKFTQNGSVRLDLFLNGQEAWYIRVSDTGPGIPAEAQERIFDAFQQLDGSTTRAHEGTGLGLAIVKQLTEAMAGEITLESTPGKGSVFTVSLPFVCDERDSLKNEH